MNITTALLKLHRFSIQCICKIKQKPARICSDCVSDQIRLSELFWFFMLTDNFDTIPIIGLKVTKRINKSLHIKRESQFEVYMYIDELTKVNEFEK